LKPQAEGKRRADERTLSRLLVESAIMLAAARTNPASVLRDAANRSKVDTDAIALKVKQEFAAKEKAKRATQPAAKAAKKAASLSTPKGGTCRPLFSSCPKIAQGETLPVSPCTPHPARSPASALRLRGRSQVPPPALFPVSSE
jgi:hypothetical protein